MAVLEDSYAGGYKRCIRRGSWRADPAEKGSGSGGQKELEETVLKAGLCTGCGACVNLCPYQASYQDRTVTLHACDLTRGRCYDFCPRTPVDQDALQRKLYDGSRCHTGIGRGQGFFHHPGGG